MTWASHSDHVFTEPKRQIPEHRQCRCIARRYAIGYRRSCSSLSMLDADLRRGFRNERAEARLLRECAKQQIAGFL